jgi:mono/diheme cytochrome c family protein
MIPLAYIALGVAIPAVVIADRGERQGATDQLAAKKVRDLSEDNERGKELFLGACAQCHDLDAVNARGIAGPDLDEIGALTPERVTGAIERGGTGQGRMPAQLLEGENARAVARYLADVAGK